MAQFMALGELNGLTQARRALANTLHTVVYEPRDREIWEEAYERYRRNTLKSGGKNMELANGIERTDLRYLP